MKRAHRRDWVTGGRPGYGRKGSSQPCRGLWTARSSRVWQPGRSWGTWGGLFKGVTGENPDASGMWAFLGTPCPASAQSLTHLAFALSCGHSCLYLMKARVRVLGRLRAPPALLIQTALGHGLLQDRTELTCDSLPLSRQLSTCPTREIGRAHV